MLGQESHKIHSMLQLLELQVASNVERHLETEQHLVKETGWKLKISGGILECTIRN